MKSSMSIENNSNGNWNDPSIVELPVSRDEMLGNWAPISMVIGQFRDSMNI
jgi:hypothetical protein